MINREFDNKAEATKYLKQKSPKKYGHIFENEDCLALFEIIHEAYYEKKVFNKVEPNNKDKQLGLGHSAYIPKLKVHINIKKGSLISVAAAVDLLFTNGLSSILLNQIMTNPQFINRLSKKQHLVCLMKYSSNIDLNIKGFHDDLKDGKCNHPEFVCKYEKMGYCMISESNFLRAREDLKQMKMIFD